MIFILLNQLYLKLLFRMERIARLRATKRRRKRSLATGVSWKVVPISTSQRWLTHFIFRFWLCVDLKNHMFVLIVIFYMLNAFPFSCMIQVRKECEFENFSAYAIIKEIFVFLKYFCQKIVHLKKLDLDPAFLANLASSVPRDQQKPRWSVTQWS